MTSQLPAIQQDPLALALTSLVDVIDTNGWDARSDELLSAVNQRLVNWEGDLQHRQRGLHEEASNAFWLRGYWCEVLHKKHGRHDWIKVACSLADHLSEKTLRNALSIYRGVAPEALGFAVEPSVYAELPGLTPEQQVNLLSFVQDADRINVQQVRAIVKHMKETGEVDVPNLPAIGKNSMPDEIANTIGTLKGCVQGYDTLVSEIVRFLGKIGAETEDRRFLEAANRLKQRQASLAQQAQAAGVTFNA